MNHSHPSRILVVDDHRPTRQSLCLLLRDVGYACSGASTAADARIALGLLAAPLPALVILDLWMPHEDGESLLRWIRGQSHLDGTRVLIYSAAPEPDHAPRLLAAGADGFLTKPTAIPSLLHRISQYASPNTTGLPTIPTSTLAPDSSAAE
jgi:DNA-binding response OmpR family regulator